MLDFLTELGSGTKVVKIYNSFELYTFVLKNNRANIKFACILLKIYIQEGCVFLCAGYYPIERKHISSVLLLALQ